MNNSQIAYTRHKKCLHCIETMANGMDMFEFMLNESNWIFVAVKNTIKFDKEFENKDEINK